MLRTKSAKAKGVRLEKKFAKMLRDAGLDQYARNMPLSGAVAGLKQDIYTKLPFAFECKNIEKQSFHQWYRQAEEGNNIGSGKIPVVVWSKNFEKTFVYFGAQDFINLLYYAVKGGFLDD